MKFVLLISLVLTINVFSKAIDLRGRLLDKELKPIEGATVSLVVAGSAAMTDKNGNYHITDNSVSSHSYRPDQSLRLVGSELQVNVQEAGKISVQFYNIRGMTLAGGLNKELIPGYHSLALDLPRTHPGLFLMKVKLNNRTFIRMLPSTGHHYLSFFLTHSMAKLSPVVEDTIVVKLGKLWLKPKVIDTYQGSLNDIRAYRTLTEGFNGELNPYPQPNSQLGKSVDVMKPLIIINNEVIEEDYVTFLLDELARRYQTNTIYGKIGKVAKPVFTHVDAGCPASKRYSEMVKMVPSEVRAGHTNIMIFAECPGAMGNSASFCFNESGEGSTGCWSGMQVNSRIYTEQIIRTMHHEVGHTLGYQHANGLCVSGGCKN